MSEFFGRLETELRVAAERRPRRSVPVPAIAVACVLALAAAPLVVALGSGEDSGGDVDGTVVQRSPASEPPPEGVTHVGDRGYLIGGAENGQMIASGVAPVSGDWLLKVYANGEGRCVALFPGGRDPGEKPVLCLFGGAPDPPFTGQTIPWPAAPGEQELLTYGAAPTGAVAVELVRDGEVAERVETIESPEGSYYVMPHDPEAPAGGVLRWVDAGGNAGDHEIPVNMP
jgi:hypothetical protein